jgi:hypothetical protein
MPSSGAELQAETMQEEVVQTLIAVEHGGDRKPALAL